MKLFFKNNRTFALMIGFIVIGFNAISSTYYVNSSSGSDLNAGTSSGAAFKSFNKAYTVAVSGDIINLTGTFDWTSADEAGDASGSGFTLAKNLTIIGQSASSTFIQAAATANTADRRVFTFNANVTLQNVTLRNGKNTGQGGGMYASGRTLNFTNVAIENNYGVGGGAGFFSGCTINFTNCTFEGNNSSSYGGAFYSQQGILTLTNCTFSNNTGSDSILAVENYYMAGYELNLTNVTVANNTLLTTSDYHGHVYQAGTQIMRLKNCLFAKNLSPNTATKHDYLNYSSTAYTVAEYNLIENDYNWAGYGLVNGVNNNIIGNQASATLSTTLALNSSTNGTKTLALVNGSPAINMGSATANGTISIPTSDQRGVARSGNTDIGSYEYIAPPTVSLTGTVTAFSSCSGAASSAQNVTVSGTSLTASIVINAPTGFEVSLSSGSGYASSISISPSSGTVASTTIYIRMTSAATGTPSGNVSVTSTGATTVNLSVSGTVNSSGVTSSAPSGAGTVGSPYLIATFSNLLWITESSSRWNAYYVQTANIDASATSGTCFNAGAGWSPIGNSSTNFTGSYNGGNFTISNLYINRYGSNYIGLFGQTSAAATIQNLGIAGVGIYGNHYVGHLVGDNAGTIDLCFASGNVTNNSNCSAVGGLVGNNTGTITRCYTQSGTVTSVSGSPFGIGGLVGINTGTGLIEKSFSRCTVISPNQQAGGLVGRNGYNTGGTVRNCYATGNVSGNLYCGGLIGSVISGVVENCYSIGLVTISDPAGYAQAAGLLGSSSGTITNCFWDTQSSGKATSSGGTGKTTAQMKTLTTFTGATWDFQLETANGTSNIWGMNCSDNNAYPFLSWEGFIGAGCAGISITGTTSAFSTCSGTPSSTQTVSVSGTGLTANILLSAPTGFEISTNSSTGFATTLTLTQSGGNVTATTIYIRMSAVASGSASGTIDATSTGVSSVTLAVSGVSSPFSVGSVSNNQIVCYNGSASDIVLSGSVGTIQWQSSTNNSTWSNIVGATSATLTAAQIGTLTSTKYFRAVITNGSCTGNSSTVTVNVNNGLAFDGSGDFVTIGTNPVLNFTSDFTIETWVYVPASPKYSINTLFSKNYPNLANPGYMFGFNNWNSTDLKLVLEDGVTAYASNKTVVAGQWNHVAVVISGNGTICTFYVNASPAGSFPVSFVGDASSIPATIGSMDLGGSYSLSGTLDEMRVWNVARTQQQLIDNLDNPLVGNESGLVAYYDFNQGVPSGSNAGLTLMDKTSNSLNGTFTGISLSGSTSNFVSGNHLSVISPSTTLCLDATSPKLLYGATGITPSSYQWYSNSTASTSGAATIAGETTNYYNAPTSTAGTSYYYLNATGTCAASPVSNFASVVIQNTAAGTITGNDYLYLGHTGTYTSSLAPAASTPWVITNTTYATTTNSGVLTALSAGTTSLTYTSSLGCVSEKTINVVPVEWTGATSNDWNTGSNWNGQYVPTVVSTIAINATATNDLHLDANKTITNLTFNGAAKKLVLGNFDLTATTINNANATNYIQTSGTGKLKMTIGNTASKSFPVGNASYNPVAITNNSGASDAFSVQVTDAVYVNGINGTEISTTAVDRTWNISKTNANAGSGINFVFNWNPGEVVNGTLSDPRMNHHTGSNWEIPTVASTNYGSNALTVTGYTGTFSPFAIAEGGTSALPIELISFVSSCKDEINVLQWKTASEFNTSHFTIEKSSDGETWTEIGMVPAAGNSTSVRDYEFLDQNKFERELTYYRLVQVDIDGKNEVFDPIASACNSATSFETIVAPNPNNGNFKLQIGSPESQEINIQIVSNEGKTVYAKSLTLNEGISIEYFDLHYLQSGIYNLTLQHKNGITCRKISIQ